MKKRIRLVALLVASAGALALASCDDKQVAKNSENIEKQSTEITEMQATLKKLKEKIDSVDTTLSASIQDEIEKIETKLTAVNQKIDSEILKATAALKTELETNYKDLDSALKTELQALIDAKEDKTAVTALDEYVKNAETYLKETKADKSAVTEVGTKVTTLETSVTAINDTITTIQTQLASAATKAELENSIAELTTLVSNTYATKAALDEAIAALEAEDKALAEEDEELQNAIDVLNASTTTINNALTSINTQITSINTTLADYKTRIEALEEAVNVLESDTTLSDKIATIETTITGLQNMDLDLANSLSALTTAAATKESLEQNVATLEAADAALEGLIDDLTEQFITAENDLSAKIKANADDIEVIKAAIETINETLSEHSEAITNILGTSDTSFADITATFDNFYGDVVKAKKTDSIYELSQIYATFQDELDEAHTELINKYIEAGQPTTYADTLFKDLYNKSNREMLGFLYKGIGFITLAKNEEEVTDAYDEYSQKLSSFINEAKFNVLKETSKNSMNAELTNIPSDELSSLIGLINAVTYDTDVTLDMTSAEVEEYYEIRINKIDVYRAWAKAIDEEYIAYDTAATYFDTLAKANITDIKGLTSEEIAAYKESVFDLIDIDEVKEHGVDIVNAVDTLAEEEYNDVSEALITLVKNKNATVAIIKAQAAAYAQVTEMHQAAYDELTLNATALTSTEFNAIMTEIATYHDKTRYDALESSDAINELYEADYNDIGMYYTEGFEYSNARVAVTNSETAVDSYTNISATERTNIKKLITDTVVFEEYFVKVDAENKFESTDAITEKREDDVDRVELLTEEASKYNDALAYVAAQNTVVGNLPDITADEITDIQDLITATVAYDDYIDAEALTTIELVGTKLTDDKAAIDFIVYRANKYNEAINYEVNAATIVTYFTSIDETERDKIIDLIKATVTYDDYITATFANDEAVDEKLASDEAVINLYLDKAHAYADSIDNVNTACTTVNGLSNVTEEEKKSICELIVATISYEGYFEDATLTTSQLVTNKATSDKNKIDLLVAQATAYSTARGYDVSEEAVVSGLTAITTEEKKAINTLIAATIKYADYINNPTLISQTLVNSKLDSDRDAIDLIVYKATKYNINRDYEVSMTPTVNAFGYIPSTEKTQIISTLASLVVYDNYITIPTTEAAVDVQRQIDTSAINLIIAEATDYDSARSVDDQLQNNVDGLTNISADNRTAIKALITAVPKITNYVSVTLTYEATATQLQTDTAAMNLIAYKATQYEAGLAYAAAKKADINNATDLTAEEKSSINTMIDAVVTYANYITNPTTVDAVDEQLVADKAIIDSIELQAAKYNAAVKYAKDSYTAFVATNQNLDSDELADLKAAMEAVPVMTNYIQAGDTAATNQLTTDTNKIDILVIQAEAYDAIIEYVSGKMVEVTNLQLDSDDATTATDALEAIPVFANYFNALETAALVTAKYASDVEKADLYMYQANNFDALLTDKTATKGEIELVDKTSDEYTSVIDLLEAIPDFANYFNKTKTDVDAQLVADKAANDLLVTRINNYKDICDLVTANDAVIDGYAPTTGTFATDDKAAFKAKYAELTKAATYDVIVANFKADDFTSYYNKCKLDVELVSKNAAKVFSDIINEVETLKATINASTKLTTAYKEAYIARFDDYDNYDDYDNAIAEFKNPTEFSNYFTTVKAAIADVKSIASYEETLITEKDTKLSTIAQAYNNNDITAETKGYLEGVVGEIYSTYTNLTTETPTEALANNNAATTRFANISTAITKISSVDSGISNLASSLTEYVNNAKNDFLNSFNEPVYKNATKAWNKYSATIDAKVEEVKYSYTLPETNDYTTFTTFVDGLSQKNTIESRITMLSSWYENDVDADDDGVQDGMLYILISEYQTLEAQVLPGAKTTYIQKLTDAYNNYLSYDGTDSSKPNYSALANQLKLSYNSWKAAINNSASTTTLIANYNSGLAALDGLVLSTCKDFYIAELEAQKDVYIANNPTYTTELTDECDTVSGVISGASTTDAVLAQYTAGIANFEAIVNGQ